MEASSAFLGNPLLPIPSCGHSLASGSQKVSAAPPGLQRVRASGRVIDRTYYTLQSVKKGPISHIRINQAELVTLCKICSQLQNVWMMKP